MKKKSTINLFFLLCSLAIFSQTIVTTSVEDRKTVLEEFTGIHCVFCPEGHVIAQNIQNNNPDDAFLINIHVGSFSVPGNGEPDFRTQWGTQIANQSGLIGYPAGTVNRQNFPGQEQGNSGTTAMSRNQWTSAANQVMANPSYVNVGVEADINVSTNTIEVHVEAYYTGTSPEGTNLLNVALLQNNTLGPQTGGNMGNNYVHQHRLIEMITGQWGINIPTTTGGTFVDETFSYPIPADHNGIPIKIEDLEVVAYVSETHQYIPSGSGAYPTYSGFDNADDITVKFIKEIGDQCGIAFSPSINIQNIGSDELTSMTFQYSVNGGTTQSYDWTGSLASLQNETIELPEISYTMQSSNLLTITLQNDDDNSNNTIEKSFEEALEVSTELRMVLKTYSYGSQCTWDLKNSAGDVLYSGGPYANDQTIDLIFNLLDDCHIYTLNDSSGNSGPTLQFLRDSNNTIIAGAPSNWGYRFNVSFTTDHTLLGVNDNKLQNVSVYPNPASSFLTIQNAENANIKVYDILGKLILTRPNISLQEEIEVSKLQSGNYFIKIEKDNEVATKKFIVIK